MDTAKRSFRLAMLSSALLVISFALVIVESNTNYKIKVIPDTIYRAIATILSIIPPVSFVLRSCLFLPGRVTWEQYDVFLRA